MTTRRCLEKHTRSFLSSSAGYHRTRQVGRLHHQPHKSGCPRDSYRFELLSRYLHDFRNCDQGIYPVDRNHDPRLDSGPEPIGSAVRHGCAVRLITGSRCSSTDPRAEVRLKLRRPPTERDLNASSSESLPDTNDAMHFDDQRHRPCKPRRLTAGISLKSKLLL